MSNASNKCPYMCVCSAVHTHVLYTYNIILLYVAVQVKSADFQQDPIAQEYDLRVHDQIEKVEGRVLDPPAIQYKGNETVRSHRVYLFICMFIHVCVLSKLNLASSTSVIED